MKAACTELSLIFPSKSTRFFSELIKLMRFQRQRRTSYTYEDERGHSPCPRTGFQALPRSISPRPAFSEAVYDCILPWHALAVYARSFRALEQFLNPGNDRYVSPQPCLHMPVLVYKNERVEERADRRSWTPSDARLTWLEVQRQTLVNLWGTFKCRNRNIYIILWKAQKKLKTIKTRYYSFTDKFSNCMAPFL